MERRIEEMRAQINTMQQQSASPAAPDPAASRTPSFDLTSEEQQTYSQALPVIRKVAGQLLYEAETRYRQMLDAKVQEAIQQVTERINSVEGSVNTVQQTTAHQFNQQVIDAGAQFGITVASLPHNSLWMQFLNEPIVQGSHLINQTELQQAIDTQNIRGVSGIFRRFIEKHYPQHLPQQQQQQQPQQPPQQYQQQPPQQQQVPDNGWDQYAAATGAGRVAPNSSVADDGGETTFKVSDYEQFVAQLNRGMKTAEEFSQFDAQFSEAMRQGRVTD